MVFNVSSRPIASLREEDLRIRYKIRESIVALDESSIDKFRIDCKYFETVMEDQFVDEYFLVKQGQINVLDFYLKDPYKILNEMICRLYGEETNTHFRMEWFSMAYTVFKTRKAFNSANILSFNISSHIWEAKSMKIHVFYMKIYHIYVVCVEHVFLAFNWI
jgi:hypothetical protein